jgi:hypothetical protein
MVSTGFSSSWTSIDFLTFWSNPDSNMWSHVKTSSTPALSGKIIYPLPKNRRRVPHWSPWGVRLKDSSWKTTQSRTTPHKTEQHEGDRMSPTFVFGNEYSVSSLVKESGCARSGRQKFCWPRLRGACDKCILILSHAGLIPTR